MPRPDRWSLGVQPAEGASVAGATRRRGAIGPSACHQPPNSDAGSGRRVASPTHFPSAWRPRLGSPPHRPERSRETALMGREEPLDAMDVRRSKFWSKSDVRSEAPCAVLRFGELARVASSVKLVQARDSPDHGGDFLTCFGRPSLAGIRPSRFVQSGRHFVRNPARHGARASKERHTGLTRTALVARRARGFGGWLREITR